jgi:hypothetical protein
MGRASGTLERIRREVRVPVFVDIDEFVVPEVDGIRTGDPGTVVVVRIEHLHGHRFPAAG